MGSRKVFMQHFLSSRFYTGTKNVNPLNFQGIILIQNLGTGSLVFEKSSSTLFRDKEQSSNDKYRKKNPFRDGKMSIKINS